MVDLTRTYLIIAHGLSIFSYLCLTYCSPVCFAQVLMLNRLDDGLKSLLAIAARKPFRTYQVVLLDELLLRWQRLLLALHAAVDACWGH